MTIAGAAPAAEPALRRLSIAEQLVLNLHWFGLNFHWGALLAVAGPRPTWATSS